MTTLSTGPRPLPRPLPRQRDDGEDRKQAVGPATLLAVQEALREALREAFTDVVDDVRLAEIDGVAHVYVSIRPTATACPERIRAAARAAYLRAVRGEPVVAHVAACSIRPRR